MLFSSYKVFRYLFMAAFALIVFSGCRQEPPPPIEAVRAIKTITVSEIASGRIRKFSGVVEAADKSSVSFEVAGNVQEVSVNVGDKVSKGDVLAVLDKRTYELNVKAAEAALGRSRAKFKNSSNDLKRLKRIAKIDTGAVSEARLDNARAEYASTKQQVEFRISQLNLAKRDLEKTVLQAPFDGHIAERLVEPFYEIARGQRLFDIYMEGAMEAAVSIPESEIHGVYLGLPSEISFPTIPGKVYKGIVTEISKVAGNANAFPVKVTIEGDLERIRPGMTAEVNIMLAGETADTDYLVPVIAIAAGDSAAKGYV
ncbi:MAG: efflux RND transporter periplasmic adaptor subunit, partial [Deltaproteobacteria bacterium]|nr:efflux RND transporter periplasmic adaptor subunit [Deltaproteobacteria bacterium]